MPILAGALVVGGLFGAMVALGHADLLALPAAIVAGALAVPVVVVLLLLVGAGLAALFRRRPTPPTVADEAEAWLRKVA